MVSLRGSRYLLVVLFFFLYSGFVAAFDHPNTHDHSVGSRDVTLPEEDIDIESSGVAKAIVKLPPGVLSQRDWMQGLVDALGFSYGLPEEPKDADFIKVLSGDRSFRLEVESMVGETEPVSTKTFSIFGSFSGDGWVSGVTRPVVAKIPFLLPRSGTYRLAVSVRNSPHHIVIGDETFTANGGDEFTLVDLGNVYLEAGELNLELGLPAGGAIDYIDVVGENLPSIEPSRGWQPDERLTREIMATTIVQALGLTDALPLALVDKEVFELEVIGTKLEGLQPVAISYFGRPSGGKWLRGSAANGKVQTTLLADEEGYYRVGFRGLGAGITFLIDGRYQFERDCKPFLSDIDLGVFSVSAAGLLLDVALPPRGGADMVQVELLDSSPAVFTTLAGLRLLEDPVSAELVNRMFTLVSAVGSPF